MLTTDIRLSVRSRVVLPFSLLLLASAIARADDVTAGSSTGAPAVLPSTARETAPASLVLQPLTEGGQRATPDQARRSGPWQVALRTAVLVGVPVAVTIYGQQIWDWGKDSWRTGSEGFFGYDTPHGGADKLGHGFAHYLLFRGAHAVFRYTENGSLFRSNLFAGTLAGTIGLGIEIGDGFNGTYGFCWQDLVADLAGIGLGLVHESFPAVDDLLGVSAFYWPTTAFRADAGKSWLQLEGDTSGWTYYLSFKLAGVHHLGWTPPRALQYFSFDLGYFTRGYSRWDRMFTEVAPQRVRSFSVGISLNLAEVVDTAFRGRASFLNRAVQTPFRYYHVPVAMEGSVAID